MLMIMTKTSMQVMQELGLIGLRIQRMPSEPNLEFGIPSQYSYMTVRSHPLQCCTQIIWEYNEKSVLIENGTEIQRGCVDWCRSFFLMFQVCAPSCHDCSTLRAWWEEDEGRRSRFYKTVVGSDEEAPSRCTPEVVHFIVQQHFDAPSMWAIFPLQVRNLNLWPLNCNTTA